MPNETTISDRDKKLVQRSALYPYITIAQAIEFAYQLKNAFSTSQFTLEDAVNILKKSDIQRDIGACVQFGLLEKQVGKGYKVTSEVNVIMNYVSLEEREDAIRKCFERPKLYSDLIERFKDTPVPPDQQFKAI